MTIFSIQPSIHHVFICAHTDKIIKLTTVLNLNILNSEEKTMLLKAILSKYKYQSEVSKILLPRKCLICPGVIPIILNRENRQKTCGQMRVVSSDLAWEKLHRVNYY